MRKWILAAGAAALAIAAPVAAEKPDNKGQGKGGQSAKVERGGKAARGGGQRAVRQESRGGNRTLRAENRGGNRAVRTENRRGGDRVRSNQRGDHRLGLLQDRGKKAENRGKDRNEARARVANDRGRDAVRVRGNDRRQEVRVRNNDRRDDRVRFVNRDDRRDVIRMRGDDRNQRVAIRDRDRDRDIRFGDWNDRGRWGRGFAAGFVDGCPPGLAKKHNGCMPPGQAKKLVNTVLPTAFRSNALPLSLRDYWRDDDDYYYRYGDGYVYRVNRDNNLIASLLPLFGGGYGLGQAFPYYNSPNYFVPSAYQPFFADSQYVDYRYNNGYVYAVDPYNGMIDDIIPLYDRGYGVGQMLPASYGYYNLPYPYRDWYPASSSDYQYRYAPGAIYQVDPTSSLITAVVSLLAPGLSVGQPMPMGYSAYNVPYAYRDRYYDSPDAWYRYSNGYIYQVDPTTRLVTAVLDSIV